MFRFLSSFLINPITKTILSVTAIVLVFLCLSIESPEIYGKYLRNKVGEKTYMIKGHPTKGGGGTGFAVQAPSGVSYIVTNSHVCEGVKGMTADKNSVYVVNNEGAMLRKIIVISDESDLCLIEGLPDVDGLKVSGSEPGLGEFVTVVGHPHLRPLSISRSEIVGVQDVEILGYFMKSGNAVQDLLTQAEDGKCDMPKNKIIEADVESFIGPMHLKICLIITKAAYMSTAVIYPGNSGSPVVNWVGRVIGVAFASDSTNWAYIVSLNDLNDFLRRY